MATLHVKKTPDGRVLARRTDGKPLTDSDRREARQLIQIEEGDPILQPGDWYPEFCRLHHKAVDELPPIEWSELRQTQPELYRALKETETKLDRLQEARLSEVIEILTEWRRLLGKAQYGADAVNALNPQPPHARENNRRE